MALKMLVALAVTGKLGAVQVGVHLADLVAAYGEPVALGRVSKKRLWPHRFGLGSLEMVFCRCRTLTSLTIPVWRGELELPGPGPRTSCLAVPRITESEMIAALRDADCDWDVVGDELLPDQRTLETTPAETVRVGFVCTAREGGDPLPRDDDRVLSKIGMWGPAHGECPEPDRNLPDDGFGA